MKKVIKMCYTYGLTFYKECEHYILYKCTNKLKKKKKRKLLLLTVIPTVNLLIGLLRESRRAKTHTIQVISAIQANPNPDNIGTL